MLSIWKYLPAHLSHELAPLGLKFYSAMSGESDYNWKPLTWRGLHFRNRMGIAGGVDKNAEMILDWQKIGAGFVEIGTVTPRPQDPNPGKIVERFWEEKILWNRMGFPSEGVKEVKFNLQSLQDELKIPVLVNLGKNRTTANSDAQKDYCQVAMELRDYCDAFVVNVSSPNTVGLRDLQNARQLQELVESISQVSENKPILVKLSPDLNEFDLKSSLDAIFTGGAAGVVLTNTTVSRQRDSVAPKDGGVSGSPLKNLAIEKLKETVRHLGNSRQDRLIISVGGILTYQDVLERLDFGADLVQLFAALVFEGPGFIKRSILKGQENE